MSGCQVTYIYHQVIVSQVRSQWHRVTAASDSYGWCIYLGSAVLAEHMWALLVVPLRTADHAGIECGADMISCLNNDEASAGVGSLIAEAMQLSVGHLRERYANDTVCIADLGCRRQGRLAPRINKFSGNGHNKYQCGGADGGGPQFVAPSRMDRGALLSGASR